MTDAAMLTNARARTPRQVIAMVQKNEVALRQDVTGLELGPMPGYTKHAPRRMA